MKFERTLHPGMGKLLANCFMLKNTKTHKEKSRAFPCNGDSASMNDRHRLRNVNRSCCWFKSLQNVREHCMATLWPSPFVRTNDTSCCLLFTLNPAADNFTHRLALKHHPSAHSSTSKNRVCSYWQTPKPRNRQSCREKESFPPLFWILLFPHTFLGQFLQEPRLAVECVWSTKVLYFSTNVRYLHSIFISWCFVLILCSCSVLFFFSTMVWREILPPHTLYTCKKGIKGDKRDKRQLHEKKGISLKHSEHWKVLTFNASLLLSWTGQTMHHFVGIYWSHLLKNEWHERSSSAST